jgi:outer membrane protein assembly factor BamB
VIGSGASLHRAGESRVTADPHRPTTGTSAARRVPVRRRLALLVALLGLGLVLPALPAAAAPTSSWTSPSGGNGNAMHNPGEATITAGNAARLARAWTAERANAEGGQRPTVVGDVVYFVHRYWSPTDPSTLVAASARTGRTLWQVALSAPNQLFFPDGVTVAGKLVLVPFQEPRGAGAGLMAVDTTSRRIAWTSKVTPNSAQSYAWSGHRVYADANRAYVYLSDYTLAAYRLSDGKLQWTVRLEDREGVGIALGAGVLYVGYEPRTPGITAYDAATGRRLWTAPGQGTPVVAGSRVFARSGNSVVAVAAAGCGRATCPVVWTRSFPSGSDVTLGAADGSTLFVTYRKPVPANRHGDTRAGVIARLSAATGAQQWTTTVGSYSTPVVRGGSVVWVVNEYRASSGALGHRILGFSATGTRTSALASIPAQQRGFPQTLTVGGGTLFNKTNVPQSLVAYRVPGT